MDEHTLAKMNAAIAFILFELVDDILNDYNTHTAKVILQKGIEEIEEGAEWYDTFCPYPLEEWIKSEHTGDCIGMPGSCLRCVADQFYKT